VVALSFLLLASILSSKSGRWRGTAMEKCVTRGCVPAGIFDERSCSRNGQYEYHFRKLAHLRCTRLPRGFLHRNKWRVGCTLPNGSIAPKSLIQAALPSLSSSSSLSLVARSYFSRCDSTPSRKGLLSCWQLPQL